VNIMLHMVQNIPRAVPDCGRHGNTAPDLPHVLAPPPSLSVFLKDVALSSVAGDGGKDGKGDAKPKKKEQRQPLLPIADAPSSCGE
jgi:hypothetical protein